MIASFLRQLSYLEEEATLSSISRQTGLTLRQLQNIKSGNLIPKDYQKTNIQNAYYRKSYDRLRSVGFSSKYAREYSKLIPEMASAWEAQLRIKIHELTEGHLAEYIANYHLNEPIQQTINKYYDKFYGDVLTGIKNSRLSPEEFLDY